MTITDTAPDGTAVQFVSRKHPWRIVGVVLVLLVAAVVAVIVVTNDRFQWPVVFGYLFDPKILSGLWMTIFLTFIAMIIGLLLGVAIAVMRVSASRTLRWSSAMYVWFFRGTPVLVQLVFWYNLGYLFPDVIIGLPWMDPWFSVETNALITPLLAAILGLGLNEGAYLAEIIRAGILSVSTGQREAATSIGMTRAQAFHRIILPQAMRVIIPPTGNETIGMLKSTSLVSVIALSDLMYSAQSIYSRTFEVIPLLLTASIWYLVLTSLLSVGQGRIEAHYGRGVAAEAGLSGRNGMLHMLRRTGKKA
ncbi:amino acid ABC transporter permease [uncultured Microbacterium sp.]|uniref:Inner membrane amino-acid ABC transporter permease protein n=1 Tax=uncultured Microbacterium sp. TaxID=191216 RepID=A0A1Y5NZC7_9MICO|nr:amino acid ABC transporter permease [uncultured Microbacterium sp.]SBS71746.1 Inner membrane amino-acid ABC transporter permease protein [uncultured Microbacterium sp.]